MIDWLILWVKYQSTCTYCICNAVVKMQKNYPSKRLWCQQLHIQRKTNTVWWHRDRNTDVSEYQLLVWKYESNSWLHFIEQSSIVHIKLAMMKIIIIHCQHFLAVYLVYYSVSKNQASKLFIYNIVYNICICLCIYIYSSMYWFSKH